jgi:hypothetical protein
MRALFTILVVMFWTRTIDWCSRTALVSQSSQSRCEVKVAQRHNSWAISWTHPSMNQASRQIVLSLLRTVRILDGVPGDLHAIQLFHADVDTYTMGF